MTGPEKEDVEQKHLFLSLSLSLSRVSVYVRVCVFMHVCACVGVDVRGSGMAPQGPFALLFELEALTG